MARQDFAKQGIYNSTAITLSNQEGAAVALDVSGRTLTNMATLIAGEDLTNNVLVVEERYSYTNLAADGLVKTGAGFVHTVTFAQIDAAPTAGTIIIYDNTAESGTIIFTSTWTTGIFYPTTITLDNSFGTGLYVGYTTIADIGTTVSYR